MASAYRLFANSLQAFVDSNFKPFSELLDFRRYSFHIEQSPLQRILQNIDYFAFNYALIASIFSSIFLFSNHLLALGVISTLVLWSSLYFYRHKVTSSIPTRMCFNIKMTLLLAANILIMRIFFGFATIAELIGRAISPILLHSFLFEPVDSSNQLNHPDVDAENQKSQLENQRQQQGQQHEIDQIKQQQQVEDEESSQKDFPSITVDKMSDEMTQAYLYQQQQNIQISQVMSQTALSN